MYYEQYPFILCMEVDSLNWMAGDVHEETSYHCVFSAALCALFYQSDLLLLFT
jgi:hypothetical protein